MEFSLTGRQMAGPTGLRSIMDDIATSTAGSSAGEWLNLSIGNPALIPEVVAMWRGLTERALASGFAESSCQYGPSRGAPRLVGAIADYFNARYRWGIGDQNIVVGPGSQMLCFIAAALFAGPRPPGSPVPGLAPVVLPAEPDYTGYQGLCMHPGGIAGIGSAPDPADGRSFRYRLDLDAVERRRDAGMLLLSSPSNPASRYLTAAELDGLTGIARRRDIPLVLDHAYGEPFPRIAHTEAPPVFDPSVINCFSVSKAGLPGERIGFAIGPAHYIAPMVAFLANSALHASRLAQAAVAIGLESGEIDATVASVIGPFYATRRKIAEKLLLDTLPDDVDWRLHAADGGMFAWLWINEDWFDDLALYQSLKARKVFVAPGRNFFTDPARPDGHGTRCFRVALTTDEDILAEGIGRIAEALADLRAGAGAR
jgi:valine--pyruvate aminotransferase